MTSKKPIKQTTTGATLAFHWSYISLPLIILLLSIILTAYFYPRLSDEVAYRFKPDGSPDRWLSRSSIILWMLIPQLVLTLMAGIITWGITALLARFRQSEDSRVKPARILLIMGSMVTLPQVILSFAMLDIFSYNSYRIHLLPLWVFTLIIIVLGSVILGVFFIQAIRRIWSTPRQN